MSNVLCDLHKVWGRHLKAYAKKVLEQLPPIKQPADPSLPPDCPLDVILQQRVCAIVNTCEYCHETTGQLEESIIKALDEEYKSAVDLSPVQEEFHSVVTAGMKVLVAALESRVAPHLTPHCATASAVLNGSAGSGLGGAASVLTAQNLQPRVHVSPRSMIVPVPPFQHSPMFGQRASSHTVASLEARSPLRMRM